VLLLIQIGGLGFVTITTFLFVLVGKKINYSTRMALQESLNQENNQGIVRTMKKVLIITFACEFLGFLMLAPSMISFSGDFWSGLFKALFLSISAFCNAGVDPMGNLTPDFSNLMTFAGNELVLIPVMLLIVFGGIGFIVILDVFRKDRKQKRMMLHTRVVLWVTGILIFVGAGVFMLLEWNNPNTIGNLSTGDKIVNAFFQSITTRTAGFTTFDQAALSPISHIVSGFLMFVGGSPASISGGIKTTTLFVVLLMLFRNTDKNGNIIYKNNNRRMFEKWV
jgi:trk system potassium uptake protein TrkH